MGSRDLTTLLLLILGVLVLLSLLGMSMGGFGMMGPGMWGGPGAGLVLLLMLVAVIALLVQRKDIDLGRLISGQTNRRPLDIARERYARGEISKDQYEQLGRDLETIDAHEHAGASHDSHSHGHCGH